MGERVSYQDFFAKGYELENGVLVKSETVSPSINSVSAKMFDEGFSNRIVFPIDPIGKPRMTVGDRAKYRPIVQKYWNFKSRLQILAAGVNYVLGDTLDIEFYIEMPNCWSKEKKLLMDGKPHQHRPDIDNMLKAVFDILASEDKFLWDVRAKKFWGRKGLIVINK